MPASFAPPGVWARWGRTHLPIPPAIGQMAWECRLGPGDDVVDLQAGLGESPEARARLANLSPDDAPEAWRPALSLVRDWAQGRWGPAMPNLFLEVDMPGVHGVAAPLIFPRLEAPDRVGWLLAASAVVERLSAGSAPVAVHRTLARVLAALPDGADPGYASWLGARGTPVARWIGSVPRAGLAAFLERVAWPGDAAGVAALIDGLSPWSSHVPIGIDLGEAVGPALGVELYWAHAGGEDPRLAHVLGRLADWPEVDPVRLADADRWSRGEGVPATLAPELQVKVGFAGGRRAAKAYLGCWT